MGRTFLSARLAQYDIGPMILHEVRHSFDVLITPPLRGVAEAEPARLSLPKGCRIAEVAGDG